MHKQIKRLLLLLMIGLLGCLTFATAADHGEILIIANNHAPVDSLLRTVIADIYQSRRGKWDNGQKIMVVMLKKGPTHEAFTENIVKTTPMKLRTLWKKVVFSGAGAPPKILKTEAKLVEFVTATKGAIGYINSTTSHEGVKVITVE